MERSLVLAAFAFLSLRYAPACECHVQTVAESRAKAETSPCNYHDAALHAYAARAATVRQRALRTGILTYQDVIDAAYAPGMIDSAVLRAKAHWRARWGRDFVFVTDYATRGDGAVVQALVAVADPNLQSTLVAQYESTVHTIGIAPMATDFAIFHEAGHALQRANLQRRGAAAGRRTEESDFLREPAFRLDAADATAVRRLQYLCSQDEFEVRLQDLNRFHALLVAGRPIMDPADSLRALTAIGMPLGYEETRDAFALAGQALTPEIFALHTAGSPVETSTITVAFEDARELCLVRRLTRQIDPSCWPRLLAKMIFEVPGHL